MTEETFSRKLMAVVSVDAVDYSVVVEVALTPISRLAGQILTCLQHLKQIDLIERAIAIPVAFRPAC